MNPAKLTVSLNSLKPIGCGGSTASMLGYRSKHSCLRLLSKTDHFSGYNFLQLKQLADQQLYTDVCVLNRQQVPVGFARRIRVRQQALEIFIDPAVSTTGESPWRHFFLDTASGNITNKSRDTDCWQTLAHWLGAVAREDRRVVADTVTSKELPAHHELWYALLMPDGSLQEIRHEIRVRGRSPDSLVVENLLFRDEAAGRPFRLATLGIRLGMSTAGNDLVQGIAFDAAADYGASLQRIMLGSGQRASISCRRSNAAAACFCCARSGDDQPVISFDFVSSQRHASPGSITSKPGFMPFVSRFHQVGLHTGICSVDSGRLRFQLMIEPRHD